MVVVVAAWLRDVRERGGTGSGNEPSAGVDGLLARPLLVVTTDVVVCGVCCVGSARDSGSSALGALSFFELSTVLLARLGGLTMGSSLATSVLTEGAASLGGFTSTGAGRMPFVTGGGTGVVEIGAGIAALFVLVDADDGGLCCVAGSAVERTELARARDDDGRGCGAVGRGTGDLTGTVLLSRKFGRAGDRAMAGDMEACAAAVVAGMVAAVLLFLAAPLAVGRALRFLGG